MKIDEALNSLENSWSRDEVLVKIKNGANSESIVNDFFNNKKEEIETLSNFINPEEKILLSEIEELSNIESKLINKIKNYSSNNSQLSNGEKNQGKRLEPTQKISFNLAVFMMKWSNKFVFISLFVLSAIALSKQAWA